MTRRQFDHQVALIVLVMIAATGVKLNARRRVGQGQTAGIAGKAAQAAAVAL